MITKSPRQRTGLEGAIHRIFRDSLELDVGVDTEVIENGMLDSLAFVKLLVELENEFGIKIDLTALDLDDFSSVTRVARLVEAEGGGSG